MSASNPCAKTVSVENAYEVWETPNGWRYHVLKKYKGPAGEAKDPFAIWFCYVEGDFNESGDVYKADIVKYGRRIR